ncbi:Protein kinase of the Mitotic Exit Network [Saitoella coloradoensis]
MTTYSRGRSSSLNMVMPSLAVIEATPDTTPLDTPERSPFFTRVQQMSPDSREHYDREKAKEFLTMTLGEMVGVTGDPLWECLRDGVLLCRFLNVLFPGAILMIGQQDVRSVHLDNIRVFLSTLRKVGVPDADLFTVQDLYGGQNPQQVMHTILTIERMFSSPHATVKTLRLSGKRQHSQLNLRKSSAISASLVTLCANVQDADDLLLAKLNGSPVSSPTAEHGTSPIEQAFAMFSTNTVTEKRPTRPTPSTPRLLNRRRVTIDLVPVVKCEDGELPPTPSNPRTHHRKNSGSNTTIQSITSTYSSSCETISPTTTSRLSRSAMMKPRRRSYNSFLDPPTPSTPLARTPEHEVLPSSHSEPHLPKDFEFQLPRRPSAQAVREINSRPILVKRSTSDKAWDASPPHPQRMSLDSAFASASSMVNLGRSMSLTSTLTASPIREKLSIQDIGQYQIGNCIGRGQFGAVYRALNLDDGHIVAVKRIPIDDRTETEVDDIMKEIDLLRRLKNPTIVRYEGFVKTPGYMNIILEYVENGSLANTLKAFGSFPEKLVVSYTVKILEGLKYLHEQEVVHCDLKAANILTTKSGHVRLSDFGVSLNLKAVEKKKEDINGTPNWMAPEVILLQGASPASDIWSLGCTIIELLTTMPPYHTMNAMSAMFRIVEDDHPPIPEDITDELKEFLMTCFKKDPAERPTAQDLFLHPWITMQTWSPELKNLRPQDSIPFLRRINTSDVRPMSAANPTKGGAKRGRLSNLFSRSSEALSGAGMTEKKRPVTAPSLGANLQPKQMPVHNFVKASFSKTGVECKLCGMALKKAIFCSSCGLICHQRCIHSTPYPCQSMGPRPISQKHNEVYETKENVSPPPTACLPPSPTSGRPNIFNRWSHRGRNRHATMPHPASDHGTLFNRAVKRLSGNHTVGKEHYHGHEGNNPLGIGGSHIWAKTDEQNLSRMAIAAERKNDCVLM